jgi:ribonuclease P protein component
MNFTYPKIERLNSKILIDKVFNEGHKLYSYPLKMLWLSTELPQAISVQSLISVSKRRFKRANKRNLLKRRIREAFRMNKNSFYQLIEKAELKIALVIVYNSNDLVDYHTIEQAIINLLEQVLSKLKLNHSNE